MNLVGVHCNMRLAKVNKYKAKRTNLDGYSFDSRAEAQRYRDLTFLQQAGEIDQLELKPKFELKVNGHKIGRYTSDFRYHDVKTLKAIVEDVKAIPSRDFVLRFKLAQALYPQYEFKIYNTKRKV